jgi:tyrosinase
VPPEFRVPLRTVDGALTENYLFLDEFDRPGHPRDTDVEVVPAMSQPYFALTFPVQGFGGVDGPEPLGGLIEQEPHNLVHGNIGGATGLMRSTTVAGRDPIFWLHHANIDRLWEVWRRLPGSVELTDQAGLPADVLSEWRSASFTFGGTGAKTVYSIDDLVDTTAEPLRYEYEVTELPDAQLEEVTDNRNRLVRGPMGLDEAGPPREDWDPVAATSEATSIGDDGAETALTFDTRQLGLAPEIPTGLIIALAGVRSPTDCHNVYVVDVAAGPDLPVHRAGRFSTFGLSGTPADEERSYVVDATATIPDLVADGWGGNEVVVRVLPESTDGGGAEPRMIEVRQITVYRRR